MKLKSLLLRYYPPGMGLPRVGPGFPFWDDLGRKRGRVRGEGTKWDWKLELPCLGHPRFHTPTTVAQNPLSDSLRKSLKSFKKTFKSFLVSHESEEGGAERQ